MKKSRHLAHAAWLQQQGNPATLLCRLLEISIRIIINLNLLFFRWWKKYQDTTIRIFVLYSYFYFCIISYLRRYINFDTYFFIYIILTYFCNCIVFILFFVLYFIFYNILIIFFVLYNHIVFNIIHIKWPARSWPSRWADSCSGWSMSFGWFVFYNATIFCLFVLDYNQVESM